MKNKLWYWIGGGIIVRLVLMPITMHSQDLFFINTPDIPNYYGPVIYYIMKFFGLIWERIPSVSIMLQTVRPMINNNFITPDYVPLVTLTNLFILKTPYLLFDGLILLILIKHNAYKFWVFNPVVIHTTYMIGQCDIIPAFLILWAYIMRSSPCLCVILLCLAGAAKGFAFVLVLPTCFLLGKTLKDKLLLMLIAGIVTILLYLPFSVAILGRYYTGMTHYILMGIFTFLYTLICISAWKDDVKNTLYYFLTIGFLTYAVMPISFRYFLYILPLICLLPDRKFKWFTLGLIFLLWLVRTPLYWSQLGLFYPIIQNLPTLTLPHLAYRVGAIMLMILFFIGGFWVWQKKYYTFS